jgi:hypothetical protein
MVGSWWLEFITRRNPQQPSSNLFRNALVLREENAFIVAPHIRHADDCGKMKKRAGKSRELQQLTTALTGLPMSSQIAPHRDGFLGATTISTHLSHFCTNEPTVPIDWTYYEDDI